jgi:phosphoserine phosphatase RsbU/P
MRQARLEIIDAVGRRLVPVDKDVFTVGRRAENDLTLQKPDVSRDHAKIVREGDRYVLHDAQSRYGTFVNNARVEQHELRHGDAIRLGQSGGAEMVFLCEEDSASSTRTATTAVADLHQVTLLLEGLRALGAGGVLDEVLALVLDSAIEMSGAARGFVMLKDPAGGLEFKLARARGRVTLPGRTFATSRKIPEEVLASGETRVVTDLLDGDLPSANTGTVAIGIRHVVCMPLRLVRYVDADVAPEEQRRIGVLYLDSRERGTLLSSAARSALEMLAAEAAVAIENARLYRETIEKARLEQEMKIAAKIQQALLPPGNWTGAYFEAMGTTLPCRAIGGDFFEYMSLPSGDAGFAVADVAGKGAPAALLTAVIQGILAAQTSVPGGPAEVIDRTNRVLVRRAIDSRFATLLYAVLAPDGRLTYSNAGHNPPFVIGRSGVRRLETGGTILGLFEKASFEEETLQLQPGDVLVAFSDGLSEAMSATGEEFGDERILACLKANGSAPPPDLMERLLTSVREFSQGAVQSDDITVLVVRYGG